MRVTGLFLAVALLATTSAFGQVRQAPAGAGAYPYALDPYNPSDAALLRKFGAMLVGQTPIEELRTLDPYKPSQAIWLRQDAALPVWGASWYPTPAAQGSRRLFPAAPEAPLVRPASSPLSSEVTTPTVVQSVRRPETNDGIFITYAEQRWVIAGPAVPQDAGFARVGTYAGMDVYRRATDPMNVIFVPTTREGGRLAPFRLKP
jgi:hypothetical protein